MEMFYAFVLFLVSVPSLTLVGTADAFLEPLKTAFPSKTSKIFPTYRDENLEAEDKALDNEPDPYSTQRAGRVDSENVDYEQRAVTKSKIPPEIVASLLGDNQINQSNGTSRREESG